MSKKKKSKLNKPRNPLVEHMLARQGQGAHGKTKKTIRRDDKAQLKKDYFDKVLNTFSN